MMTGVAESEPPRKQGALPAPSGPRSDSIDSFSEGTLMGVLTSKSARVGVSHWPSLEGNTTDSGHWQPSAAEAPHHVTNNPLVPPSSPLFHGAHASGGARAAPPPPSRSRPRALSTSSNGSGTRAAPGTAPGGAPTHVVRVPAIPARVRVSKSAASGAGPDSLPLDVGTLSSDRLGLSSSGRRGSREPRSPLMTSYHSNSSHEHLSDNPSPACASTIHIAPGVLSQRRESVNKMLCDAFLNRDRTTTPTPAFGKADDIAHVRASYSVPLALVGSPGAGAHRTPDFIPRTTQTFKNEMQTGVNHTAPNTSIIDAEDGGWRTHLLGSGYVRRPPTPANREVSSSSSSGGSTKHVRFVNLELTPTDSTDADALHTSGRFPNDRQGRTAPQRASQSPAQNLVTFLVHTSAERQPVNLAASIVKPTGAAAANDTTANGGASSENSAAGGQARRTALYQPDATPVRSALRSSSHTQTHASATVGADTPIKRLSPQLWKPIIQLGRRQTKPLGQTAPTSAPSARAAHRPTSSASSDVRRRANVVIVSALLLLFLWVSFVITG